MTRRAYMSRMSMLARVIRWPGWASFNWCEALFSGFSGFGFGRVGRICLWAGLTDRLTDDLIAQHVLELQEFIRVLSQDVFRLSYEDTAILF